MKTLTTLLTEGYFITLFTGRTGYTYSIGESGYLIFNKKYIETQFKENLKFNKLAGKLSDLTEEKAANIFENAGLSKPYINYSNRDETLDSALDSFHSFLQSEKWETTEDTWIIIPKPSKKLKGKKIVMEFNVGNPNFKDGESQKMDLDVYMTPITKTTKSIKFSVNIPKFLYDKCMTNNCVEERPKQNFIEASTISVLHQEMSSYVNMAYSINAIEENAKKCEKVICINFSSSEQSTRDDYNHGYTGQKISTKFNFYVAYSVESDNKLNTRFTLFTYKKLQFGTGSTEKGIKGIIDTESKGGRHWIWDKPSIMIKWTQEREDFFNELESNFRSLSEKLNKYLSDINEEKIELLINSKLLLIENGNSNK